MRLHYYKALPNFGDQLNPWLWPQLLPNCFSSAETTASASPAESISSTAVANDDTLFLGIGTILQASVPHASRYVVLGAGCGYGPLPKIDDRWEFFAVRGPLTAQSLGLSAALAVTDAAYLLRLVPIPSPRPGPAIGFMPHWRSMRRVPWRQICEWSGLRFINPFAPVEAVLAHIRGCEFVIAEAMHGAIAADALRVPWVPVRIGAHFLDFKWRDWLASVELSANAIPLTSMDPWTEHRDGDSRAKKTFRQAVNVVSYYARSLPLVSELRTLRRRLTRKEQPAFLSADRIVRDRTFTLEHRLDALRHELATEVAHP